MKLRAMLDRFAARTNKDQLILVGLALALIAQQVLDKRQHLALSAILFALAVIIYLMPASHREDQRTSQPAESVALRGGILQIAAILAIIGSFGLKDNLFTKWGAAAWLLAIISCFVGLPARTASSTSKHELGLPETAKGWRWRLSWSGLALIAAMIIGAAMRFHQLRELPMDLGWDLPYNYTSTKRIFDEQYLIFFPDNFGREGMFFYLIALVSRFMDLTPYSIRVTSAIVGMATIPAIYLLTRECSESQEAPAYATLLLAINRWHVVLSRSGYRVSLMPLMSILLLYGLARAFRRGRPRDWAWAGLFLGLGLWTYKAFVFAIPITIGSVIVYALARLLERFQAKSPAPFSWGAPPAALARGLAMLLLVAIITALPMIRFLIDQPEVYFARELQAAKLVGQSMGREQISRSKLYASNTKTSLLMFNYEGDSNSRFGIPFQRELGYISAALFVLGLAKIIARWKKGSNPLILVAFVGLLLPMIISMLYGEKPNLFRSSGLIGLCLVLVSSVIRDARMSLRNLLQRIHLPSWKIQIGEGESVRVRQIHLGFSLALVLSVAPVLLSTGLLVAELRDTQQVYFGEFREQAPDVGNYSVAREMAQTMIGFEEGPTFVKVWPHWYDGRAVTVHLNVAERAWTAELFEINPNTYPLADFQGKLLILMHPQDHASLETLRQSFPKHTTHTARFPTGLPAFIAFYGQR